MITKRAKKRHSKVVKVPVVIYMEATECGAASLAMILHYYKKWIPLEQVRTDCGVSRDGSSAASIVRAARSYGLTAAGFRYTAEMLRSEAPFPCIIHWKFNHFVVLNGFKGRRAILNDPAQGTVEIEEDEFDRSFTGICLVFSPGDTFVPQGSPKSMLAFVKERLNGAFTPLLLVAAAGFLMAAAEIIAPVFSKVLVDEIISGKNQSLVTPFLLCFGALILFQFAAGILNRVFLLKVKAKLAIVSNAKYMWHILRLPMGFFSQRMTGDLARRQFSNDEIAETFVSKFAPILINLLLLILYFAVMMHYSIPLTMIGSAAITINFVLANFISKKRIAITRMQLMDLGKLESMTVTGIHMIETIKASGSENGFFGKWSGYLASVGKSTARFAKTNLLMGTAPSLVQEIANIVILVLGAYLIMQKEFTAGMLLAFQGYMLSFLGPVNSLIDTGQGVLEMRTKMERIEDVMQYDPDIKEEPFTGDTVIDKLSGEIELQKVTFGYSKLAEPLIKNFSLRVKRGAKIALIGSSGCGKSTIAKLISGLYKPWEGTVLFDGKKQDEIPRVVFTASLAVVNQDVILFEDSISDNIKLWDHTIEDFAVIMAARDAQIHEDIMLRNGGYNHRISEGGRNFSGGQRQRLEIAQALAKEPTIIIMDEATSALDAKTEYELTKAIKDLGVTCIIIAHRLSTIRDCDEILVMDQGVVAERGTHRELLESGGLYVKLMTAE